MTMPATQVDHEGLLGNLAHTEPASDQLIIDAVEAVSSIQNHAHTTDDPFCGNLTEWLGERIAPILRRLIEVENQLAMQAASRSGIRKEIVEEMRKLHDEQRPHHHVGFPCKPEYNCGVRKIIDSIEMERTTR